MDKSLESSLRSKCFNCLLPVVFYHNKNIYYVWLPNFTKKWVKLCRGVRRSVILRMAKPSWYIWLCFKSLKGYHIKLQQRNFHEPRDLRSHKSADILKFMKREACMIYGGLSHHPWLTKKGNSSSTCFVTFSQSAVFLFMSRQGHVLLITLDLCDWFHLIPSPPVYLPSYLWRETSNSCLSRATN